MCVLEAVGKSIARFEDAASVALYIVSKGACTSSKHPTSPHSPLDAATPCFFTHLAPAIGNFAQDNLAASQQHAYLLRRASLHVNQLTPRHGVAGLRTCLPTCGHAFVASCTAQLVVANRPVTAALLVRSCSFALCSVLCRSWQNSGQREHHVFGSRCSVSFSYLSPELT